MVNDISTQNFDAENQHWMSVRVYYEDTDFTGMVYHANYLRYFERGRSDCLREAGVSHQSLLQREDPAAFTLTRVEIDYKRAAKVEDELRICSRYLGFKGPRLSFHQLCYCEDQLMAQANIQAVMIHIDGRPRRPMPDIVDHLSKFIWTGAKSAK